jgi:hypothetical protein
MSTHYRCPSSSMIHCKSVDKGRHCVPGMPKTMRDVPSRTSIHYSLAYEHYLLSKATTHLLIHSTVNLINNNWHFSLKNTAEHYRPVCVVAILSGTTPFVKIFDICLQPFIKPRIHITQDGMPKNNSDLCREDVIFINLIFFNSFTFDLYTLRHTSANNMGYINCREQESTEIFLLEKNIKSYGYP